ncbi:uncharacterized protein [Amphiura filiformis]|uniref:uncharacterized protein n=1 Tax=Amphiura filiformis TaxID=82378 RepID=UPI003B227EA3
MPKRHLIPTLERLCLQNIASNMNGWTRHYEDNYMGKGVYRYILGPFDILGSHMVEELTDLLLQQRKLTKAALHLLLNGGKFRYLNLSMCHKLVTDDEIYLISKCKKLKSLNLSGCKRISQPALCLLAQCLQNINSLDLSSTAVDRQVMQQLLSNSQDLVELRLQKCGVSDEDLRGICWVASQRQYGMKILMLDVSHTYVTRKGVSEVLKKMPQLQVVRYPGIFDCLFESYLPDNFQDTSIDQEELELIIAKVMSSNQMGQYQMRSLVSEDFAHIPNAMLFLLPLLCPHITHVDLRLTTGFDDMGLRQLSSLMKLRELELCCQHNGSSNITFDGGVIPLLSKRGDRIEKLGLHDVDDTDLLLVCNMCPNLRGLNIFMMHEDAHFSSSSPSHHHARLCPGLQDLNIWSKHGDLTLTPSSITHILSCSTELRELNLIRTDTLTDYVLLEVMQRNPFRKLENLSLHECNAVSGEVLTQFLFNEANNLHKVKLMHCRDTTRRDFAMWKNMAEEQHYDLTIEWK